MEKLLKIVLNLSSTAIEGRYNMLISEYEILKETEKTVVLKKEVVYKNKLLTTISDFQNKEISRLQYYTMCYEKDINKAIDLLTLAMKEKIDYIEKLNKKALEAFNNGFLTFKTN